MCKSNTGKIVENSCKNVPVIYSQNKDVNDILISIREIQPLTHEQLNIINELDCTDKMRIIELYNQILHFVTLNMYM